MLINRTKLPKSTIGEEIKNENVTPNGSPALVKPINNGMDEHEQNGVTVPSNAEIQFEREYEVFRELQSGKGSADLIYVPKRNIHLPILLIEFKYGKSAEEAMNQIKEKEYFRRYIDGDYPNDILLIGINYNPKTKEHECLIEKID